MEKGLRHGSFSREVASQKVVNRGVVNNAGPAYVNTIMTGYQNTGRILWVDAANPMSYRFGKSVENLASRFFSLSGEWVSANIRGALNGKAYYDQFNKGSWYFDGSSSYVSFGNLNCLSPTTENFSLCVWFKTNSAIRRTIVSKFTAATQIGYYIDIISTGKVRAGFQTSGAAYRVTDSTKSCNDNRWHYACLVRSAQNTADIYIDGRFETSNTITFGSVTSISNSIDFNFGQKFTGSADADFIGNISVVEFWNKNLTASEVWQNYNAVKGRYLL